MDFKFPSTGGARVFKSTRRRRPTGALASTFSLAGRRRALGVFRIFLLGWHSFKRFRKTWLRGARCLEDLNNFWMAHKPQTMSELYSHLHEELQMRLEEAERVGYGFDLPKIAVAPNAPKISAKSKAEIAA
jgi:hypothetical protein